jgi:hypothetical protein
MTRNGAAFIVHRFAATVGFASAGTFDAWGAAAQVAKHLLGGRAGSRCPVHRPIERLQ